LRPEIRRLLFCDDALSDQQCVRSGELGEFISSPQNKGFLKLREVSRSFAFRCNDRQALAPAA
jgi:hypothetical protein